jgi:HAD superfamily hydrolase (TIGR01549 family)
MKRIIFDVDNTLIKWKNEYVSALEKTMKEFNVEATVEEVNKVIDMQEELHDIMDRQLMLNDINKMCNLNLTIDFIDRLMVNQGEISEIDEEVIETLEYLKDKYELYVLTNYFKEPQIGRLKKAKILDYFSKIIGGDDALIKPHKEIFMLACEGIDPSEATMVGDHAMRDIKGGIDAGLKVIQIDYFNKYEDNNEYPLIREFKKLKDLL